MYTMEVIILGSMDLCASDDQRLRGMENFEPETWVVQRAWLCGDGKV